MPTLPTLTLIPALMQMARSRCRARGSKPLSVRGLLSVACLIGALARLYSCQPGVSERQWPLAWSLSIAHPHGNVNECAIHASLRRAVCLSHSSCYDRLGGQSSRHHVPQGFRVLSHIRKLCQFSTSVFATCGQVLESVVSGGRLEFPSLVVQFRCWNGRLRRPGGFSFCDSCARGASEKAKAQLDCLVVASGVIKSLCALQLRFQTPWFGTGHDCCSGCSCDSYAHGGF